MFGFKNRTDRTGALRRAWEKREGNDMGGVAQYVPSGSVLSALAGGHDFIRRERWKNEQLHDAERPSIGEIVSVLVSRTSDSLEQVIHLRSVDGRNVSLWLRPDGSVKSITNY